MFRLGCGEASHAGDTLSAINTTDQKLYKRPPKGFSGSKMCADKAAVWPSNRIETKHPSTEIPMILRAYKNEKELKKVFQVPVFKIVSEESV